MRHRRAQLLLAFVFIGLGLATWAAGSASANCPPDDPYCMGGTTTPPATNPPETSPPQTSPPQTSPPVQRSYTPATQAPAYTPRHSTATRPPVVYQPATQPADQSIATPAAVAPSPAIAVSGSAPPLGAGVASSSAKPPAESSSGGAGTVLWAFGIGIAAVGVALGARATLAGASESATPGTLS